MADSVAGVVLSAGAGTRLRPLTIERPKALCPFGSATLVDRAIDQLATITSSVAVNAHDRAEALVAHIAPRAHASIEPELMGSAGALGVLRRWIDGRDVVLVNADTVHDADLAGFLLQWDRRSIAFFTADSSDTAFSPSLRLIATAMPWRVISRIPPTPHGIYRRWWLPAARRGETVIVGDHFGAWFDCGSPADYLAANLWWAHGRSVVGAGAEVNGELERAVVWPGAHVSVGERLRSAIRTTGGRTVLIR
jgi:MurNAc alpha-1-phosphate uridylyltransferase